MAVTRVQNASNTSLLTTVTATFGATPLQGNFLLACVTASVGNSSVAISGWTALANSAVGLAGSLDLFYKIAGAAEPTAVQATGTLATFMDLHVFEYAGLDVSPLGSTATTADSGSGVTSRASGSTALSANAVSLIFAVIATAGDNGASISWTNGFVGGLNTTNMMTADMLNFSNAVMTTTSSWLSSQRAVGIVATFYEKQGNTGYKGGR